MSSFDYDVVFIGGGPGGYVGAIKAAQLGLKTACVDKRGIFGGTCLNVGCIPSKTLLDLTHTYTHASHLIDSGIISGSLKANLSEMMKKKSEIIESLTKGIEGLFKKNKVTPIKGSATFVDANTIDVDGVKVTSKNFVIATGSESSSIPNVQIDEEVIVSSTGALSLKKIPNKMIVIGAGVIGLELGSVYARLGTEVTVVEFLDKITPSMDAEVSKSFKTILEKQGIKFVMSTKVLGASKKRSSAEVEIESVVDGKKDKIDCDIVLVSVGRRPYTQGLGLEKLGVKLNQRGFIETNSHLQTSAPSIYAIGDCILGPMLAHKAEEEGVAVAEYIAKGFGHVNYDVIPSVIYTHPEVACVGKTEEELKASGITYKVGKFSFLANSRAKAVDDTLGFVKVLACSKTDKILGCHIIGKSAGDIIHEICVAMEFGASAEDIARTCHAHPTLNEAIKEACLAVDKMQIHS
jgi:dihydrolipoamide dehydrogenase